MGDGFVVCIDFSNKHDRCDTNVCMVAIATSRDVGERLCRELQEQVDAIEWMREGGVEVF